MVLWRDYLIGLFARPQPMTRGLFLWNMRENSVFYFEVCRSFFPSPSALNPNSQQMEFFPLSTKVLDDLLFTTFAYPGSTPGDTAYRCIHLPSLVTSAQLPGGSVSLTENAFAVHLPKCIMESRGTWSRFSVDTTIYSVPSCRSTHPRYCFIIQRFPGQHWEVDWEVLEVEIDLSIPGPIKMFSRVSKQYAMRRPAYQLHGGDQELLLYLPFRRGGLYRASLRVRFLRVGKPGKGRLARLGGVDKLYLSRLSVDRDAGYVIMWVADDLHGLSHYYALIWWLDERRPGNMVYSRTKELITSWSRGLLRHL